MGSALYLTDNKLWHSVSIAVTIDGSYLVLQRHTMKFRKTTKPDGIVLSTKGPTLLEVRWRESFTLTLYATRTPGRECLLIVFGYCAGSLCCCSATDKCAHLEDARAWRASPRVGPCRVLPPQRVGV